MAANDVTARKGFFPLVLGRDVAVQQAGGVAFIAGHDFALREGGGQWLVSLGNQTIERGGGAALISGRAHVTHGFVGLLIAGRATLDANSRAFVNIPLAGAAAIAAGFALGLVLGAIRRPARG
ncbi:MAG TPA: hypothetical protein VF159_00235 [Gemmatimonadaceae bacterium]